ncbi:hypothetical protein [Kitasatospora sp. NPDC093806]|uniref:hypothetical protein n=1 Tax=Kitasatospora sp. NPDC093806 TaxID=3155075 RepID=UPI0034132FC1
MRENDQPTAGRGRTRRRWVKPTVITALVAAPLAGVGCVGYAFATWDPLEPVKVDCAEVMRFSGATMPAEATDRHCVSHPGLHDTFYAATFRVPRADAAALLLRAFPRVRQDEHLIVDGTPVAIPCKVDLCFVNEGEGQPPRGQAFDIKLEVTYDHETALVRLESFDV